MKNVKRIVPIIIIFVIVLFILGIIFFKNKNATQNNYENVNPNTQENLTMQNEETGNNKLKEPLEPEEKEIKNIISTPTQ